MTHTDGTEPWDAASLRRVAEAAGATAPAAPRKKVGWLSEDQFAVLIAEPTPVEGLVTAALLRQDSVTITPEAAADLARTLFYADLLRDQSGPAGVQDRVRLEAIRALHQPTIDRLCRVCCITSDDVQSQDCADRHDHGATRHICATVAILHADLDGESVEDFGPLSKGATAMIPARYPAVESVDFDDASEDRAAIERVRDMHQTDGSEPPSCAYCFYIDPTWPCHTIAALDGAS